jgi:hypothetical protein
MGIIMIIDAYATDTVPSHEVRRRALEALTNEGEPMSEVTYDALRKRLAQAEAEIEKLHKVIRDALKLADLDAIKSFRKTLKWALGEKE